MITYDFRYNVSTSRWLKRMILVFFLLLFCSMTKIIPIDVKTQIINNKISSYVHLSKLEVHKDSGFDEYFPLNPIDQENFKTDLHENKQKEVTEEKPSSTKYTSLSPRSGSHVTVEQVVKSFAPTPIFNKLPISELRENIQIERNETISSDKSTSIKPDTKKKMNFHQNKKTCKRMRMELGGENQKSILTSFGKGRLGNKLASFASTYAMSRDFGLYNYISENQYRLLSRVFDLPRVKEDREDSPYYVWRKCK